MTATSIVEKAVRAKITMDKDTGTDFPMELNSDIRRPEHIGIPWRFSRAGQRRTQLGILCRVGSSQRNYLKLLIRDGEREGKGRTQERNNETNLGGSIAVEMTAPSARKLVLSGRQGG